MDRFYPSALRIAQRRRRQRVAAGIGASLAAAALAFAMLPERASDSTALPELEAPSIRAGAAPVLGAAPARRPVYRYSVVPGGAMSQAELARVVRSDKVVATHYAGFDVDQARLATVAAPRAVHVSYRKGDKVYWTARKVTLQPGETLLTDGENEMRARCANRISDVPRFPVEAHAPALDALDATQDGQGELAQVDAGDLAESGDLQSAGQSYALVWPDGADPAPTGDPKPARTPFDTGYPPGLPWLPAGWRGGAGVPPQSGAVPDMPGLADGSAPPMSGAMTAPVGPVPVANEEDPGNPAPLPAMPDLARFIPPFDPARPAPPSNPVLEAPRPADVPEPATPWLVAAALVAMLGMRRRSRP